MREYLVTLFAPSTEDEIDQLHQDLETKSNGKLNTSGMGWDEEKRAAVFNLWLDADGPSDALCSALEMVPVPVADDWRVTCPS